MSKTLTEAATYSSSVTVPESADQHLAASVETGFQALANRTKFLKEWNREHGCVAALAASGLANSTLFTVSSITNTNSGQVYSEPVINEVEVPEAGWYEISIDISGQSDDTTNPTQILMVVQVNESTVTAAGAFRYSATATQTFHYHAHTKVFIADPPNERIRVQLNLGEAFTITGGGNDLKIKRVN